MADLPIACRLTDAELRARRDGLLATLRRAATAAEWMPEGLALEFRCSDTILREVLDLIAAERACCPFLKFRLQTGPGTAPTRLTITGPAGSRAFLESLGLAEPEERRDADGAVA